MTMQHVMQHRMVKTTKIREVLTGSIPAASTIPKSRRYNENTYLLSENMLHRVAIVVLILPKINRF